MTDFLIIARSGRALAVSAHRAGYRVHVMDNFADEDTKAVSNTTHQLSYHCDGFDKTELISQVKELISYCPKVRVVVGSGFEKTPELLDSIAEFVPVLSNDKSTIHSLKDPVSLCDILRHASINAPEISLTQPTEPEAWLSKKVAGIGGAHVQWVSQLKPEVASDFYYQKHIPGIVSSAVFLAMETHAILVGINEQLQTEQFNEMPFLYKGVVSLKSVDEHYRKNVIEIINKITIQTGLIGLCGIDFIVDETGKIVVLEINPRPPSSLEVYDQELNLFDAHLACFEGREIDYIHKNTNKSKGYAIYYANEEIKINNNIDWPDWVKDIPSVGLTITKKFPVCTVHAEEDSTDEVKAVLEKKLKNIEMLVMKQQHAA